jgi:hypothetical protein
LENYRQKHPDDKTNSLFFVTLSNIDAGKIEGISKDSDMAKKAKELLNLERRRKREGQKEIQKAKVYDF